jgi:uncharacterized membrane protein
LNFSPWGISLFPIVFSLSFFTIIFSIIGAYRQYKKHVANAHM